MQLHRNKLTLAAVSGLLQAVTWFVLSLLAVLTYKCEIDIAGQPDPSIMFVINLARYYVADVSCGGSTFNDFSQIVTLTNPYGVFIISCINISTSTVWAITSLLLIYEAMRPSNVRRPYILWSWVCISAIVCVCDLGTTINFAVDYANVMARLRQLSDFAGNTTTLVALELLSYPGFMMSMSGRGFVLWVVNIAAISWVAYGALSQNDKDEATSLRHHFLSPLYQDTKDVSRDGVSAPWTVQSPVVGASPRPPPWASSPTAVHKTEVSNGLPAPLVLPLPRPFQLGQPPAHRKRSAPIPEPDYDRDSMATGSPRQSPPRSPRHASEALRRKPPPLDEAPRRSALKRVPAPAAPPPLPMPNSNDFHQRRPAYKTFF